MQTAISVNLNHIKADIKHKTQQLFYAVTALHLQNLCIQPMLENIKHSICGYSQWVCGYLHTITHRLSIGIRTFLSTFAKNVLFRRATAKCTFTLVVV